MNFQKAIPEIEKAIGYRFKDKSLLTQAFTRTSFCNEAGIKSDYQSNEVLEFIGDSVLSTSIITRLISENGKRYAHGLKTDFGEGDFSNIKSHLSDKKNLSGSMRKLGLQKHLIMGEGDAKLEIENEPSVMEDLFESIIGAVYLDCGMNMETVMKTVSEMLDISAYTAGEAANRSAKNALQEWCADKSRRLPPPRYETLSEEGPDHKKTYIRACYIGEKLLGRGEGKNFKAADAKAAEAALNTLMSESSKKGESRISGKSGGNNENIKSRESNENRKGGNKIPSISKAPNHDAPAALKKYAADNNLPSPEFKDLGEVWQAPDKRSIYKIECKLREARATGEAYSKTDARKAAAENLLALLSKTKESGSAKKPHPAKGKKANPSSIAKAAAKPPRQKKQNPRKTAKNQQY